MYKNSAEFRKVLEDSGLTQENFANKIGKTRATVGNWLKNGVSFDNWLLVDARILGKENMHKNEPNAKPFKSRSYVKPKFEGNCIFIPISAEAGFSSGNNNPAFNDDLETWPLPFLPYLGYCFEVNDHSMVRTLRDGEKVFVEQQHLRDIRDLQDNKIHVVELPDGTYTVKRVSRNDDGKELVLMCDNPKYKTERYPIEDIKRIWKVKNTLKWDLGFMEDMENIDTYLDNKAAKLDMQGRK